MVPDTSVLDPGAPARPVPVEHRSGHVPAALLAAAIIALTSAALASFALDRAFVAVLLVGPLVVLSGIDIERGIIPNRIVGPATAVVLLAQLALFPEHASRWLLAPLVAGAVLVAPALFGRSWLGMGDVKLALFIGAGLGWGVFGALLVASLCVFPVALLVLARGGVAARKTTLPFGPFMSIGAIVVLFAPQLTGLPGS
jgi:leader peptidase (prepilin peptidase)/N-methyltransferase